MKTDVPRRGHHSLPFRSVRVNRVRVDPMTMGAVLHELEAYLDCGRSHVVHFIPADTTVLALGDPSYREVLNAGDLNLPDGMPVVWAARLNGARSDRLAGTDTFRAVARWGLARGLRHYLYGGTPDAVAALAAQLQVEVPRIRVVGAESPPFGPVGEWDLEAGSARMRRAGADMVWVGVGTPKQDLVADRLRDLEAAPILMCVGAAFDFVAGTKIRSPVWMQRVGLEWLWRLASEPRRLWRRYLIGNVRFVAGVASDLSFRGDRCTEPRRRC